MKLNKLYFTFLLICIFSIFIFSEPKAQDVTLTNQAQVDAFVGTTVTGNLSIIENTPGSIQDLTPLLSLTSVVLDLFVYNNSALADLYGLSNLTSVGGDIFLINNTNLTEFCGTFPLLNGEGLVGSYIVSGNADNPLDQAIIAAGACSIEINIKLFLEGPYSTLSGNMSDSINTNVPLTSPYPQDSQTVSSISPNVVDWVLVELRDKTDRAIIKSSRSAFVLQNGNIVDMDGTSPLSFNVIADNYYVTVLHRNHLSVMSNSLVLVN